MRSSNLSTFSLSLIYFNYLFSDSLSHFLTLPHSLIPSQAKLKEELSKTMSDHSSELQKEKER